MTEVLVCSGSNSAALSYVVSNTESDLKAGLVSNVQQTLILTRLPSWDKVGVQLQGAVI